MKCWVWRALRGAACVLVLLHYAEGKQVRGTVTDPSGAVVAGATVSVLSAGKQIAATTSDDQGRYTISFAEAKCMSCQLACSAPGFAATSENLNLTIAGPLTVSIKLAIEVFQESVGVESSVQPWLEQLDLSELRESAAMDVGQAMTQIPGVNKIRKGGIDNDLVIRGFQQNNINVAIDGARIYGACPGHMDPPISHTDFAEVERVDVQEGAFDVTSAGSLGAKVNVVMKKPPLGFHVVPSFAFGSFGFYNPSVTASFGKERFRLLTGYSYRVADPFNDGRGNSFLTVTNYNATAWKQHAFEFNTGWLEFEFALSENQQLRLRYTRQSSGVVLYPYLTMDANYDHADLASFKYEIRNLASHVRALRLNTYFTQVVHAMDDHFRTNAMDGGWTMYSNARSLTGGGVFSAELMRDLTVGAEGYYRNWDMMGYMRMMGTITGGPTLPDVGTNLIGTFVTYSHAFTDRIKLNAGARFDHASTAANAVNLNTSGYWLYQNTRRTRATDNYGSGNVRLTFSARNDLDLFAGAGTTGRVPDGEERFINRISMKNVYVGNPELPYVRNNEGTLGVIYHRGSKAYVKASFFYSAVDNYILVSGQPLQNKPSNAGMWPSTATSYTSIGARLYGGELQYSVGLPYGFALNGGGGYTKGGNNLKPEAGVFSTNLPEMPPLRAWTALRYTRNYFFGEVGGMAASAQNLVDTDLKESPTSGWGTMNVKVGTSYRKFVAIFVMENALNHYYHEHLSYYRNPFSSGARVPEPGRNYFAQLKYTF